MTEDDEWNAEILALQAQEWLKDCPHKERCPGALLFTYLLASQEKIKRQAHYIKFLENGGK